MTEREVYISGLRELARFLEDTPDFPLPTATSLHVWPAADGQGSHLADFQRLARLLGNYKKQVTDSFFWLNRHFGPHELSIVDNREKVCTPRVVGQKTEVVREPATWTESQKTVDIVEWDCPSSILAGHRG